MYRIVRPKEIVLKHNNSTIRIVFGDLFSYDGLKVIPVSRHFFETEVVTTSLQNIVIQKFSGSDEGTKGLDKYKESLLTALKNKEYEESYRDATQKIETFYPLGTTASIDLNNESYLLFAITITELKNYIPPDNCTTPDMWIALKNLWHDARGQTRGKNINIPLIGSGITGINLPSLRILELNLLAILDSIIEEGKITDEIRIILHYKFFEEVDLDLVKQVWKGK